MAGFELIPEVRDCDFVFAPDADSGDYYQTLWRHAFGNDTIRDTAALNTGLYCLRASTSEGL